MTNYGFCGPMSDMNTVFADKETDADGVFRTRLPLLYAGCWFLLVLVR